MAGVRDGSPSNKFGRLCQRCHHVACLGVVLIEGALRLQSERGISVLFGVLSMKLADLRDSRFNDAP